MTVEYKHEVIIEWSKELTLILCVCEVGTDALHIAVTRTNYQAETGCTKLIGSHFQDSLVYTTKLNPQKGDAPHALSGTTESSGVSFLDWTALDCIGLPCDTMQTIYRNEV